MRNVLLLSVMLLFPLVSADTGSCDYQDSALLTVPDATGAAGGDIYVVNDLCQVDGCLFSIWIYQETNGHAGLQRGDEVVNNGCSDPDGGPIF